MKFVATFEVTVDLDAKSKEVATVLCKGIIKNDLRLSVAGCGLKEGCYSYEKKSAALKTLQKVKIE